MNYSIGILVIGSLFWDEKKHRQQWRNDRLDISSSFDVYAPIRYGRESQSRGSTYTMVFSKALEQDDKCLGVAKCIPCRNPISEIESLVSEAEAMWAAEQSMPKTVDSFSAKWGSIGLLINPDRPLPLEIIDKWSERVGQEKHYGNLDSASGENIALDQNGLLNIDWPKRLGDNPLEFNALLATATNPTIVAGQYPGSDQISEAWLTDTGREHDNYFHNNRRFGIRTFQDEEIAAYLKPQK